MSEFEAKTTVNVYGNNNCQCVWKAFSMKSGQLGLLFFI